MGQQSGEDRPQVGHWVCLIEESAAITNDFHIDLGVANDDAVAEAHLIEQGGPSPVDRRRLDVHIRVRTQLLIVAAERIAGKDHPRVCLPERLEAALVRIGVWRVTDDHSFFGGLESGEGLDQHVDGILRTSAPT